MSDEYAYEETTLLEFLPHHTAEGSHVCVAVTPNLHKRPSYSFPLLRTTLGSSLLENQLLCPGIRAFVQSDETLEILVETPPQYKSFVHHKTFKSNVASGTEVVYTLPMPWLYYKIVVNLPNATAMKSWWAGGAVPRVRHTQVYMGMSPTQACSFDDSICLPPLFNIYDNCANVGDHSYKNTFAKVCLPEEFVAEKFPINNISNIINQAINATWSNSNRDLYGPISRALEQRAPQLLIDRIDQDSVEDDEDEIICEPEAYLDAWEQCTLEEILHIPLTEWPMAKCSLRQWMMSNDEYRCVQQDGSAWQAHLSSNAVQYFYRQREIASAAYGCEVCMNYAQQSHLMSS